MLIVLGNKVAIFTGHTQRETDSRGNWETFMAGFIVVTLYKANSLKEFSSAAFKHRKNPGRLFHSRQVSLATLPGRQLRSAWIKVISGCYIIVEWCRWVCHSGCTIICQKQLFSGVNNNLTAWNCVRLKLGTNAVSQDTFVVVATWSF